MKWWQFAAAGGAIVAGWLGARRAARGLLDQSLDRFVGVLTTDPYRENLMQMLLEFSRVGVLELLEIDLRAKSPKPLDRPLGSRRYSDDFDRLSFHGAQLARLPLALTTPVASSVLIGPAAERPLRIEIPILIAGMAYGSALSEAAKCALAQAASRAGTATNTGDGPFLLSEREQARRLVVQYHRGDWMDLSTLAQADAVEIVLGQGATGPGGRSLALDALDATTRRRLGLAAGVAPHMPARFAGFESPTDLRTHVEIAREKARGVPVGVKLSAHHGLEDDLRWAVDAGVDFISLDGAQAGTYGGTTLMQDAFGLPTLIGLCRARGELDRLDPSRHVTLLVGGGLHSPSHFLKCLALGADAVYVGTAAMIALMAGQQVRVTPFEPPTDMIMDFGKATARFDADRGADSVAHYLMSCAAEMREACLALGKASFSAISSDDLCALDCEMADFTGTPMATEPVQSFASHSHSLLRGDS